MLLERALGMKKIDYLKAYDFFGHPLVETRGRFLRPTRFGDEVAVETAVVACGRSSFKLEHRLSLDGTLSVEGFETRVWVGRDPVRSDAHEIAADPRGCRGAADASASSVILTSLSSLRGAKRRSNPAFPAAWIASLRSR